jgi:hypothetical protein
MESRAPGNPQGPRGDERSQFHGRSSGLFSLDGQEGPEEEGETPTKRDLTQLPFSWMAHQQSRRLRGKLLQWPESARPPRQRDREQAWSEAPIVTGPVAPGGTGGGSGRRRVRRARPRGGGHRGAGHRTPRGWRAGVEARPCAHPCGRRASGGPPSHPGTRGRHRSAGGRANESMRRGATLAGKPDNPLARIKWWPRSVEMPV